MRFWKKRTIGPPDHVVSEENRELARSLRLVERRLYLTDAFLDSYPTDEEILAHFTQGFRFITEAKVVRESEMVGAPTDGVRAMVIVRGVRA